MTGAFLGSNTGIKNKRLSYGFFLIFNLTKI